MSDAAISSVPVARIHAADGDSGVTAVTLWYPNIRKTFSF
mgnify:CR=1 FL=1